MRIANSLFSLTVIFLSLPLIAGNLSYTSQSVFLCNVSGAGQGNGPTFQAQAESLPLYATNPKSVSEGIFLRNEQVSLREPYDSWGSSIRNITLNSQSDNFGAGYKLTFCYLGPLEDKTSPMAADQSQGIYGLNIQLNTTQIEYAKNAKLHYSIAVKCDLRRTGYYFKPRIAFELSPGNQMEIDSYQTVSAQPFDSNLATFETNLNDQFTKAPRFCQFEFTIIERSQDPRSNRLSPGEINLQIDVSKQ